MELNFAKGGGLIPAIVQDVRSNAVLMLGYMNPAALEATRSSGLVTFFSRSRQILWTKGERSGNTLRVHSIVADCDRDTVLIFAEPKGPICHTGSLSCFDTGSVQNILSRLEFIIRQRRETPAGSSYVAGLFQQGLDRIAQKVGEEAVELLLASKNECREHFLNEAADLLFHILVLLQARDCRLSDVEQVLEGRATKGGGTE